MSAEPRDSLQVVVGIATVGRPKLVSSTIDHLMRQTRLPELILVSACDPKDVAGVAGERAKCIYAPRGLTKQRNAILEVGAFSDVIVFFDDDFLPHPSYIEQLERIFIACPDVAMVTGHVIADGIIGPGFTLEQALQYLDADIPTKQHEPVREVYNGYGCNMAVRVSAAKIGNVRFDENLPLYGWQEDVDFSRRLQRHGRIVRATQARGVHMGVKSGRESGVRLGYSQVANPTYLMRKSTFSRPRALSLMARNVVMNIVFSFHPEPYVDRAGRLRGNVTAIRDLLLGKLSPERILSM